MFNVKRGLRNADGTGVLVGLTSIGDVHGYIIDENEKVPVEGRLFYRGYDVADLVDGIKSENRFGFEEVCYLLLFGELPNRKALDDFSDLLGYYRRLPENFTEDMILKNPSQSIMNKLARAVLSCYSYDDAPDDLSIANVTRQSVELIARFPTMVAYGYQALCRYFREQSLVLHDPDPELGTAENFLKMIRSDARFTRLEAEILDLLLVLHAEHGGGNNSAFTVHVVTSSATDTYSAIASAVGSLKGNKHGGASLHVAEMMSDLKRQVADWSNESKVRDYLRLVLEKKAADGSGLIYGMGHAVYTLSDPRAVLLKKKAAELAEEKGAQDEFALYDLVERLAPQVFQEARGTAQPLCANVDFYSGFVYQMLGLDRSLYTPLFAIGRVPGWCAHRLQEAVGGSRIIRPAYKNIVRRAAYVPMSDRPE